MDTLVTILAFVVLGSAALGIWMIWQMVRFRIIEEHSALILHSRLNPASSWGWFIRPGKHQAGIAISPCELLSLWEVHLAGWLVGTLFFALGGLFATALVCMAAALGLTP